MSTHDRTLLLGLARAALDATTHEELDQAVLRVLEPAVGEDEARRLLAGTVDISPVRDDTGLAGDVAAVVSSARGRIERERRLRASHREIAASERLARLLLESAGEGIYAIDLEGRCIAANREAMRLLGYDHEGQLLGRNMHDLVHHTRPDGTPYPEQECRIFQAYRDGHGVVCTDEVLFRSDGSSFPVEYRSYPIVGEDGQLKGSVLTFFDIAERKAAEDQLRRLHAERRATALSLHDTVVQALATANYARQLGEDETTAQALEQALQTSQALVSQLLADSPIDEHVLVRAAPSLTEQGPG